MNRKHLAPLFVATCLLCGSSGAQTPTSEPFNATALSSGPPNDAAPTNAEAGQGSSTSKGTAAHQKDCDSALSAVRGNIQSQLSGQTVLTFTLNDTSFVYSAAQRTHCVVQMKVIDSSGYTYSYTLNYDVDVNGVFVYAQYNGTGTDPYNLYTYQEAVAGLSPAQVENAPKIQKERQQIGPYLDILLDPKTTYTAHIEIYSKLCAAKLNDADLIKRSQAQNLLDALAKDYMNAVYVPPSEQQRWGDLQSIYCVMYGIFPENAHKSLSMLDATSASALSAVEWSITEISSEGSQASDMLPTLMKWYHQTMIQPDDTNNWTQSNRAMQDHESLVPIILSLAGDNTKTYLTMMTHDPDSQVAQEATDSLLKLTAVPTAPVTHIQSSTEADLSNFPLAIKAAVLAAPLVYPRQAILAGTTGVTQVAFDYLNGNAINIHIASSSGDKSLDRAAMDAVQRAQYPSPPPGIVGKLIHIVVPITFSLGG